MGNLAAFFFKCKTDTVRIWKSYGFFHSGLDSILICRDPMAAIIILMIIRGKVETSYLWMALAMMWSPTFHTCQAGRSQDDQRSSQHACFLYQYFEHTVV